MRIALIGSGGQLGTDLARVLPDVIPLTHGDVEIADALSVNAALASARPEIVVNAAAYNLVDQAEDERELAFAVNAHGPRNLAQWCRRAGSTLVHVSTDYVFGADRTRSVSYREDDPPGPLGVYGETKLRGEQFVRAECERHFVIRTCGLYGRAATKSKGNFVQTMLRLAGERDELRIVNDQHCTPSFTQDVARMIAALITKDRYGLYHVTNAGQTTWYDFACEIFRRQGIHIRVAPISTSEYPTKAQRPAYSVLNCAKAESVTGIKMPPWQDALGRYLDEERAR